MTKANHDNQKYILVVEAMKESLLSTLESLIADYPQYKDVKLLLLSQNTDANEIMSDKVVAVSTDYSPNSLETIFAERERGIVAVLCRGEKYIQYLRKVLPYLPTNVLVPSDKSLEITTNKRLMRQAFIGHSPEITPRFVKVNGAGANSVKIVSSTLSYPVIVKPASLASSLMIQRCNDEAEVAAALKNVFNSLAAVYKAEGRTELPEVIVEEFLIGSFYSIDAYAMQKGTIFYVPIVEYLPAESMGIDDFFLYKRWTPVNLPAEEVQFAQEAVRKSIQATGLEHSSVHAELVRTADGWKIIEIGPRIGRFRNIMYKSAFGIDHGYNDLLIHLGQEPHIDKHSNNYVAAYSVYPRQEGILKEVRGLDKITENIKDIKYMNDSNISKGKSVRFARNGGHALAEIVFSCESKQAYDKACRWFDENVYAVVEGNQ